MLVVSTIIFQKEQKAKLLHTQTSTLYRLYHMSANGLHTIVCELTNQRISKQFRKPFFKVLNEILFHVGGVLKYMEY